MRTRVYTKPRICLFFLGIFSLLFLLSNVSIASGFPFRAIAIGDSVPALSFQGITDGSTVTIESLKGSPAVLVFWGADMETKKARSLKTFKAIEEIMPFLEERKVKVLLVNAQGDEKGLMQEVVSELSGKIPSYMDEAKKAYGDLGIFVVPSVLLIDKDSKVVSGLGYSHDFTDRMKGEVAVMLGEKTRAEVEKELRPEMKEKSEEEKKLGRHVEMAMVMIKRGQVDSAISELQKAIAIKPDMVEAQAHLGCLYIDKGQLEEANKALGKALELDDGYLPANICDARIMAEEGQIDDALGDLKALMFRNSRNAELHFTVGTLLEKQEKYAEAAKEYRKAYELVSKEVAFEE